MTRETMTLQKEELNPLKDKASFSLNIINEGLCRNNDALWSAGLAQCTCGLLWMFVKRSSSEISLRMFVYNLRQGNRWNEDKKI